MALYRVLRPLQKNNQIILAGGFISSENYSPQALERLEAVGAVAPLHAPPLSELPNFDGAEQLATVGIVQADQLLEANIEKLNEQTGIGLATLRVWCIEVTRWLISPVDEYDG